MKSWQIFNYAQKLLTPAFLQKHYTRSYSLIQKWAADPCTNSATADNPIDRITAMLAELDMVGRPDVARAAIDLMARPLGGCFAYKEKAVSDKGTVDGEAGDALVALGELLKMVRKNMADGVTDDVEKQEILEAARKVKRELDELLAVIDEEMP
jgi:hypothetical protein